MVQILTSRTELLADQTPPTTNLVALLRWRALHQAQRTAYTLVAAGEVTSATGTHLTYGMLDRQARAVAAQLQKLNAAGERVLLLHPPGLEYIAAYFGCLYAGAIAVPAYPPRHSRHTERLQAIAADAQAQLALTTDSLLDKVRALLDSEVGLGQLRYLASDSISEELGEEWVEAKIESEDLAHLQYTSGSTATPKGVMVTHGNLMHNSEYISRGFEHSSASRSLTWLPHFHDMGLLDGIIQPLYNGFHGFLMSPTTFLQQPHLWLQAISRYQITHTGGPNFAYDLCVRSVNDEQLAELDLSSWRVAYNGAEPIRSETLERFVARFGPCGFRREAFYPAYGLAEATLKVTGGSCADEPALLVVDADALKQNRIVEVDDDTAQGTTLVGVGHASLGSVVRIANPENFSACLPGQIGEVWVAGPSVARGYWNRPEETAQTFAAYLAETGEGPFMRTGDLGFLKDGELYVTGRLKDLIIIRGLNHYPQDIELTVERSNPFLRAGCGAAFSVEVAGEERLVVVQEVGRRQPADVAAVIADIRRAVAEHHELQVYAVVLGKLGSVPRTTSGKIQRRGCRSAFLAGQLEEVASDVLAADSLLIPHISLNRESLLAMEPVERFAALVSYLLANSARVLKVNPEQLNARGPLTSLGLDSLMAVELKNRVESDLQVHLSVGSLLEGRELSRVAEDLLEQLFIQPEAMARVMKDASTSSGSSAARAGKFPLSQVQQAIWFLHEMAPDSAAYNVAVAVRASSRLDAAALHRAFRILIARHDSLRTTFAVDHETPVQQVQPEGEVYFEEVDTSGWTDKELPRRIVDAAHRPFDLARGPVMRAHLFSDPVGGSSLLLVAHHLVVDGWSCWVLLKDLQELYRAEIRGAQSFAKAAASARYVDFVRWEEELLASSAGERLWSYWQRELSDELPVLKLFGGSSTLAAPTFRGASHHFEFSGELLDGLKALAQAEGTTLYTLLLAAFQVLLHRYTGQDDILVGSPVAARTRAEFAAVVGCFFNAVVLRADLSGDPTFKDFLGQMRARVLSALDHQNYPSHLLTQRLREARDHGRRQLFQVTFNLQKVFGLNDLTPATPRSGSDESATEPAWSLVPLERRGARAELELELIESDGALAGLLQYSTELCDAASAARLVHHYQNLLQSILAQPGQRLSRFALLDAPESRLLVDVWSTSGKVDGRPICVHEMFDQQVEKTPEKEAAVDAHATLTYRELNAQADQLASLIRGLTR